MPRNRMIANATVCDFISASSPVSVARQQLPTFTLQNALFPRWESNPQRLAPEGFRYQEDIMSEAEEAALAASLAMLELKPFEFHGHLGNRRVASFGLRYDYSRRSVETADRFPSFLTDLRNKVAKFAGGGVDEFQQGGVNEY